jgi:hypothetical protein
MRIKLDIKIKCEGIKLKIKCEGIKLKIKLTQ